ncbi:MAG: hypothetical protein KatS3mg031_2737 [Chitinophagales bacterium]|nr:MAG: hypothetical protein KatS3mg031_2737 [Chitinophagales bacterium]
MCIKSKSQKLSVLICILSLILPFGATYGILQIEKYRVKENIKYQLLKGIEREQLVLLKFTSDEAARMLHWEHDYEFEYNGNWYDVVDRIDSAGVILFYCWPDYKETIIRRQLTELIRSVMGQNPLNKERQERLFSFLSNLFAEEGLSEISLFHAAQLCLLGNIAFVLPAGVTSQTEPPPEFTFCLFRQP